MSTFLLCLNINALHLLNIMFLRFAITQSFICRVTLSLINIGIPTGKQKKSTFVFAKISIKINCVFFISQLQHNNNNNVSIHWAKKKKRRKILNVL